MRTGGLHGVGASVVNALSMKLVATVKRDGFEYRQEYAKGTPLAKLEKVGPFRGHGTSIYFEPDETIFKVTRLRSGLHQDAAWRTWPSSTAVALHV